MNLKKVAYGLVAIILVFSLVGGSLVLSTDSPNRDVPAQCGIESCHGMDITCGPNVPEMCTMEYVAGDNCRSFAKCETVDGLCAQAYSPKFEECKSCGNQCEKEFQNDSIKFFECESLCANT